MQEHLSAHRVHQRRLPVFQTTSRENHRAERIWPEVNIRINYPVKSVLVMMENEEVIDMRNANHKFAVSRVTIRVVLSPILAFIRAWNSHRIPGQNGGIPNVLAEVTSQISALNPSLVPFVSEAVCIHENSHCQLTRESTYGTDSIQDFPGLQNLRERDFTAAFPSMEAIFSDILHNNGVLLRDAILFFISLSQCYSELVP